MPSAALELWGGVECTVARIGDTFRDQVRETGHRDRAGDLDAIAALGIRTLRYPILWETIAPDRASDWAWHDARLARLRELKIRPIAGLIHHGSGPRHTNLLDPAFPRLLARHAERVARRYPWIEDFTPVNEPLTTARFSALYGHWYPHARSYGAFLTALVHECRATVIAMRAIRRVTPTARLIQTDDFGKTFSTPHLAYQAEHENGRRWLAFDLLCGRVDRDHPWWQILRDHGIAERALSFFLDAEGAPDIIGINHYLTSERYLDQRLHLYPPHLQGGNDAEAYADVEAVRMRLPESDLGPAARLREVWQRYRKPVAVTEVHHGCTRDEQLRWLAEVWCAAETVRSEGADIRAVTIWSLFGTVDWNTLLTQPRGIYEPGAFDARAVPPRPTALAHAARDIAATGDFQHPVLGTAGWWRRPTRYYDANPKEGTASGRGPLPRTLLVSGAGGPFGEAVMRLCEIRGLDHSLLADEVFEGSDAAGLDAALDRQRPWAVVDAAGIRGVHDWEDRADTSLADDGDRAARLAAACARRSIPLVTISSDLVFDGTLGRACRESDEAGSGRADGVGEAEAGVRSAHPDALIVRAGPLFGPWDGDNFPWSVLQRLAAGLSIEASDDIVSPTYVPDLVHVVLDLLIDGERGIWHLANPGDVSWYDFARDVAQRAGFDPDRIIPLSRSGGIANRALATERGLLMPPLASALDRFFQEIGPDWTRGALGVAAA